MTFANLRLAINQKRLGEPSTVMDKTKETEKDGRSVLTIQSLSSRLMQICFPLKKRVHN